MRNETCLERNETHLERNDTGLVRNETRSGNLKRRCKQATGCSTVTFGGMSIILVGDIAQLPPITDQVLYHTKPKSELAVEGYCMYTKFETVVKFEINERARGADDEQQ